MLAWSANRLSPLCHVVIEHTLGGAVSRIDRNVTAFNHRDVQYSFLSLGVCTALEEAEKCVWWARELWGARATMLERQRIRQLFGSRS
jgi:hypothetical protein